MKVGDKLYGKIDSRNTICDFTFGNCYTVIGFEYFMNSRLFGIVNDLGKTDWINVAYFNDYFYTLTEFRNFKLKELKNVDTL